MELRVFQLKVLKVKQNVGCFGEITHMSLFLQTLLSFRVADPAAKGQRMKFFKISYLNESNVGSAIFTLNISTYRNIFKKIIFFCLWHDVPYTSQF